MEFLLRSGDIDEATSRRDTTKAMQEGQRIHKKIQNRMGAGYRAEVPLKNVVSFGDYELTVEGRADGIFTDSVLFLSEAGLETERPDTVVIDEIKGIYKDVMKLEAPIPVHLAQAKCYAAILVIDRQDPPYGYPGEYICVQMTYVNLDNEEERRFREIYTYEEITTWYNDLLESYRPWADLIYYGRISRQASIKALRFPFVPREGQNFLMGRVYGAVKEEKPLFIQAPTGTGKTIATVYPALKAVGDEYAETIFYLTAKTVTRKVAVDTFSLLTDKGYSGRTVEISSKDRICPLEKRECNPEKCERAKGHLDRINDCLYKVLTENKMITRPVVEEYAKEALVCPFELSLDVSSFSDAVICDYNYVFDPNVRLQRFFGDGRRKELIFLIDESHNLLERAREMYSETLVKEEFLSVKKVMKDLYPPLVSPLEKCNKVMLTYKKRCEEILYLSDIDELCFALLNLYTAFLRMFDKKPEMVLPDEVRDFYFRIRNFLDHTEYLSKDYTIYCDFGPDNSFRLHLFCVDPAYRIQECLDFGRSAVFFSATLLPIKYYKKLLCKKEDPDAIYAKSVFPPENRKIIIGADVTSRYKNRSSDMYKKYAIYIKEIVTSKKGNYMAFFPSYIFMEKVEEYLDLAFEGILNVDGTKSGNGVKIIKQNRDMTEEDRTEFLRYFEEGDEDSMDDEMALSELNEEKNAAPTLLGLCVLGGVFSEGIDLTGESLIGAIVIGTGLPQVSNRLSVLKDHFDENGENGFSYAYLYPGMNKVLQAAGRVIRTVEDRGIIALLDERFLNQDVSTCFPREWTGIEVTSAETVRDTLAAFWAK